MFMVLMALGGAAVVMYWAQKKAQETAWDADSYIPEEQRLRERLTAKRGVL